MIVMTGILAFVTDMSDWGLSVFFFTMAVCGNTSGAIGFTMNKELFPIPIAGTATGLVNIFTFTGGALCQPLIGHLLERGDKVADAYTASACQNAFPVLFICAWIAFGAALCTLETFNKY